MKNGGQPVQDRSLRQTIGTEAHAAGDQAIHIYSTTDVDTVLVVFPELVGSGLVNIELVERWNTAADLVDQELVERLRTAVARSPSEQHYGA